MAHLHHICDRVIMVVNALHLIKLARADVVVADVLAEGPLVVCIVVADAFDLDEALRLLVHLDEVLSGVLEL